MKKLTSLFILAAMALSIFTACATPTSSSAGGASSEKSGFSVGLIQLVEHPSLDEIRTAFTEQLEAEAAKQGITVTIDYKNAQNDPTLINSICRQFVDDKVDAIVAIATPAAQGAAAVTSEIPIVFSAITDPVGAGLLENMQAPEGNITGTSDAINVERIFNLAQELTPNIAKYGFIYNKGEANSISVIEQAKQYLDSKGIAYIERTVTSEGEVQQASRVLLEDADAIFAPIDNTVANAMNVLSDEAIKAGKPVYVAADSMVNDGGLATVGVNYVSLGKQTADMTLKILTGTPIAQMPVEVLTDVSVVVNPDTAQALGIDVSKYTA